MTLKAREELIDAGVDMHTRPLVIAIKPSRFQFC